MNDSETEEQSSQLNSYKSHKDSNLSRFLARITPSLLKDMKLYLQKNKFFYQDNIRFPHKISLYQDIYAIVTLKENEVQILKQKGKMKQTLKEIASYTKRSYCTTDERMRKKIHQLTPQQLSYYIQHNKDICFRGQTKMVNTDEWPQYLKTQSNHINLDSDNDSEFTPNVNLNPRIFKPKPPKKKFDVVQQIERISNEPQDDYFGGQNDSNLKALSPISKQKSHEENDLKESPQRQFFDFKLIGSYQSKNLENYFKKEQDLLLDTKIVYNFKKLQYILINKKVIQYVAEDLRRNDEINKQSKRKHEIEMKAKKRAFQDKKNTIQEKSNKRIHPISIDEQEQDAKSTVIKKTNLNIPRQTAPQIIDIQVQPSQTKHQQRISVEQKAQKLIGILQNLLNNTNIQSLHVSTKNLFRQGIEVMALTKQALQKQKKRQNQLTISDEKIFNQTSTNEIQQKVIQKSKQRQTFNLVSSDEDERQEISVSSCSNISENQTMYWFNNDAKIYADYQQNPIKNRYLMWTQKEDAILLRANCDFIKNSADFEKLIKTKSAEMVKKRIDFLKLQMNVSLRFCIQNILRSSIEPINR